MRITISYSEIFGERGFMHTINNKSYAFNTDQNHMLNTLKKRLEEKDDNKKQKTVVQINE